MKFSVAKGNSSRTPFLEKQVPPEKLELVWDNWRSQPECGGSSHCGTLSVNTSALASSSHENIPSTPMSSKSAKRWGLFGSKKATPDSPTITVTPPRSTGQHELTRKKSKVLKKTKSMCRTKSSADLKGYTPGPSNFGTVNFAPPVPNVPSTPMAYSYTSPSPSDDVDNTQFSGAALYFTVDPTWDESKGDAQLYFLSSPGATATYDEGSRHDAPKTTKTPHNMGTAMAHYTRPPRSIGSVVGSDNQTSFLFIE